MAPPIPTNCHACDYSLEGIDRPSCPECGADITPTGIADATIRAERRANRKALAFLAASIAFAGIMTTPRISVDRMTTGWLPFAVVVGLIGCFVCFVPACTRFLRTRSVWGALGLSIFLSLLAPIVLGFQWIIVWSVVMRLFDGTQ